MESTKEFAVRYLNSIRGDLNPEDHVASFIAVRAAAPDLVDEVVKLRKWQQEVLPWLGGSIILWDIETKLRSDYKYTDLPEPVIDYIEKLRDQIAEWKAEYHLPEEEVKK